MGHYALVSVEKKREFQTKFLPDGLKWEEHDGPEDLILDKSEIAEGTYLIYTFYFFQAGLRIPFDPLLVDFLHRTRLQIGQVAPNAVRIILGIAEINKRFNMQLDFWDIKYCYDLRLSNVEKRWNLTRRGGMPSLVLGLWNSSKYMYSDLVVIKDRVEHDPSEHPVPKFFGGPSDRLFERSNVVIFHADQLNAIFHHEGFSNSSQLTHSRPTIHWLGEPPSKQKALSKHLFSFLIFVEVYQPHSCCGIEPKIGHPQE